MQFIKSNQKLPISDNDIENALNDAKFDKDFCDWVRCNMEHEGSWDEHLDFLSDETGFLIYCNFTNRTSNTDAFYKDLAVPLLSEDSKSDKATIITLDDFLVTFNLLFTKADKIRNESTEKNLLCYLQEIQNTLKINSPKLQGELNALIFMLSNYDKKTENNQSHRPHVGK